MKHISILVPKGAVALGCIEGSFILFNKVNDFLAMSRRPPLFKVQLVGLGKSSETYDRLFSVKPDASIKDVSKTDLIIVPAVNGDWKKVVSANKDFLPWITGQYKRGAEVASLCVGAFLLAATGLLKGRRAATHWLGANDFRKMYPDVRLVSESVITDENGLYTSGGALSFWNLLLYLIEKYTDRDMAIFASKFYEVEIDRHTQSTFLIFTGQKDHRDDSVRKAQEYIEQNWRKKMSVDEISDKLAVGRRSLERRFKKATDNTVSEYIQRVKIEAAKKTLEGGRKNVNEAMYEVGYSDIKAFRTVFKRFTGLSPMDYRSRYSKEAAWAGAAQVP